jgi:hypothetical protein
VVAVVTCVQNLRPRPASYIDADAGAQVGASDLRPTQGRRYAAGPWVRLSCPRCGRSVDVTPGSQAWCTRCPGRPEMEESAT